MSTDSYFGHLYAVYAQSKGLNLISGVSFGDHEFDLKRRALTDTARSEAQSKEVDFQSQVSYNIPLGSNFMVSPYAALAYSAFWMKGFQEHNSEANLKISDDQTNSLQSMVGVKIKYEKRFTKGIQKASVEAHVAWDHEYGDAQSRGINAEGWQRGIFIPSPRRSNRSRYTDQRCQPPILGNETAFGHHRVQSCSQSRLCLARLQRWSQSRVLRLSTLVQNRSM